MVASPWRRGRRASGGVPARSARSAPCGAPPPPRGCAARSPARDRGGIGGGTPAPPLLCRPIRSTSPRRPLGRPVAMLRGVGLSEALRLRRHRNQHKR